MILNHWSIHMRQRQTIIFADTHCGYLYNQYPCRQERLRFTKLAVATLASYLEAIHAEIGQVILIGDLVEKLYPTSQYDPELAVRQLEPLGKVLSRYRLPLVYIAGNCDPYYDTAVQRRVAASFTPGQAPPLEGTIRTLFSDTEGKIGLQLPG